jgi:hypothetical protein
METQRSRRLGHTATGPFGIPRHISFADIGSVLNPPGLATSIRKFVPASSIWQALAPILNPSGFTPPRFPEITTPRDRRLLAAEQAANVVPVPRFDEPGFEDPTPRLSPTMTGLPQFEESGFEGQFAPVQPTTDVPTFTESGFLGQEASVQPVGGFVFPEIDETNPLEIEQRIGELEVAITRAMDDEDNPDWDAAFEFQGEIKRLTRKLTGQDRIRAEKRADKLAKALADAQVAAAKVATDARTAAATAAADARTALATAQNEWQAGQSETALASQAALAEAQRTWQATQTKQTQQFGLLSTLLPLLLQQQQQQAQFGQTQGLAQQRFAQEQAQTRRFETERQEELDRDLNQRKQAASLIPQLFPNMEIDEAILAGGIDPSLIPVLISLARLRAEQDVAGQRPTSQPIVTFAR